MKGDESDFIQLAEIQHYTYCPRQWGLIHLESEWRENVLTLEGHALHRKAHDEGAVERRGARIIVRGMQVKSYTLGVNGSCDVVELQADDSGVLIPRYGGRYRVLPIEYKRGQPKSGHEDLHQLTLQAMCLEEMLATEIGEGALYYGEIRHRVKVALTQELRAEVVGVLADMRKYIRAGKTPLPRKKRGCAKCSLKDLCLPGLTQKTSVKEYLARRLAE